MPDALVINRFIWADLSSYDTAVAERFYGSVLGWDFADSDIAGYRLAMLEDYSPVAAVYPMPDKFAKIKMPPFWMPYIAVTSAAKTAQKAGECGGRVEMVEPFGKGEMALIRDPSGAGFSVHDGDGIVSSETWFTVGGGILGGWDAGHRVPPIFRSRINGYELFVPDAEVVGGFYESVFGWRLIAKGSGRFRFVDKSDFFVAAVQEADDDIRGNKQYWAVHFATDSLAATCDAVVKNGGHVWDEHNDDDEIFASSPGGEFFILSERRKRMK